MRNEWGIGSCPRGICGGFEQSRLKNLERERKCEERKWKEGGKNEKVGGKREVEHTKEEE